MAGLRRLKAGREPKSAVADTGETSPTQDRAQSQRLESIGRMAGGLAHDLNNLLTVINGYSNSLLDEPPADPRARHAIGQIHDAGVRAAGLTCRLLGFLRNTAPERRITDLNAVVKGLRLLLSRLVGESVDVRLELAARDSFVFADPLQLEQILMNLAGNARDAMSEGGDLTVRTAVVNVPEGDRKDLPAGDYVTLSVSDTGCGIDDETRGRMFDHFFTTKPLGQGTGLGLSLVRDIVQESEGFIEVDTSVGAGTTFRIYLPRHSQSPAASPSHAAGSSRGGEETILLVDDMPQVREFAAGALSAKGYHVIQAPDGESALAMAETTLDPIHLLLTDVIMPRMPGAALADRLRARRPAMQVLMMSGHADAQSADAQTLCKPFTPSELFTRVRAILDSAPPVARIIVADDEPSVRGFLRSILETVGYEVYEAAHGGEVLRLVRTNSIDLVITDLVMPEVEGIETIRALNAEFPSVGIIAISGAFEGEFLRVARRLGASAVLAKPFGKDKLLKAVSDALQHAAVGIVGRSPSA